MYMMIIFEMQKEDVIEPYIIYNLHRPCASASFYSSIQFESVITCIGIVQMQGFIEQYNFDCPIWQRLVPVLGSRQIGI